MILERNVRGLKVQQKSNSRFLKTNMKINNSKEDQPMEGSEWSCSWYYYTYSLSLTKVVEVKRSHFTDISSLRSGRYMRSFWSLFLSSRLTILPISLNTTVSHFSKNLCLSPPSGGVFLTDHIYACLKPIKFLAPLHSSC